METINKQIVELEKKIDLIKKFWEKYLESDILEQRRQLGELGLVDDLAQEGFPDWKDMTKEKQIGLRKRILVTILHGYLDDMRSTIKEAIIEDAFEKLKKRISIQGNLSHRIVEINGEYKHLHDYVLNEIVIDIINEIKSEVIGK
jgi:hypothetical protein